MKLYIFIGIVQNFIIKMEHILDETVPSEDLKKFEQKYHLLESRLLLVLWYCI